MDAPESTDVSEWSAEEVQEWAKEHYGDEVAQKFDSKFNNFLYGVYECQCTPCVEEGVDGETLLMLVTMGSMGSMEQYKACGLATVKDQMKLRKLIGNLSRPSADASSQSSASQSSTSSYTGTTPSRGKLNKEMLRELTPEDKRVYLMMYAIILIVYM